jgi:hypothetical protein
MACGHRKQCWFAESSEASLPFWCCGGSRAGGCWLGLRIGVFPLFVFILLQGFPRPTPAPARDVRTRPAASVTSSRRAGGFSVTGPSKGPDRNRTKQTRGTALCKSSWLHARTRGKSTLPDLSNFHCLPGRAGRGRACPARTCPARAGRAVCHAGPRTGIPRGNSTTYSTNWLCPAIYRCTCRNCRR